MSQEVIDLLADFEDLSRAYLRMCERDGIHNEGLAIIERWFIVEDYSLVDEDEDEPYVDVWYEEGGNVVPLRPKKDGS